MSSFGRKVRPGKRFGIWMARSRRLRITEKTMESKTMRGVVLPGNSTVDYREQPVPTPAHGQVLVKMKASSICGSDIRAIYRQHLGVGDEAYRNVIAGHEPCG